MRSRTNDSGLVLTNAHAPGKILRWRKIAGAHFELRTAVERARGCSHQLRIAQGNRKQMRNCAHQIQNLSPSSGADQFGQYH
jgi:hypothetical protein